MERQSFHLDGAQFLGYLQTQWLMNNTGSQAYPEAAFQGFKIYSSQILLQIAINMNTITSILQ